MRNLKTKSIALTFCLSSCMLRAQERKPAIFMHTDKSVYTGNEIIWFTGYIMNLKQQDADAYTTMYVSLTDPVKKQTVLSARFVLEQGLCQGVLQIPDSFPAGEYALVAYTDHLFGHSDDAVYQQWISVRYNNSSPIPFYRHPADSCTVNTSSALKITLLPDSTSYHKRVVTHWKVLLKDSANRPVKGFFSVACIRNTRLADRAPDIRQYPRSCFIVPGLLKDRIPPFFIQVSYANKKKLKSPVSLLVSHNNTVDLVKTEKDGSLQINPDLLKGSYGTNVLLSVIEKKFQDLYSLSIEENDQTINGELALRNFPFWVSASFAEEVFTPEEKEMNKTILARVIVRAKRKPDYLHPEYYQLPLMDGPCAAWICSCGHWKCNACPPARTPVKGCSYQDQATGLFVTYNSCPEDTIVKPFIKKIKAISYPRAFQGPDFTKDLPDGTFYNTTLYWNYLILTDKNGEATFDFFTNDLTGHFTCIIQGISTAGLISAGQEIAVAN